MLDSIRTLKSLFSKGDPEPVRPVSAALPVGYHSPREVDVLCCSPLRKNCLQQIWESSSLPAEVYKRLYLAPMNSLLARVQNVPAAEQGRWSYSDGFGDLTLQFTTCAVRMAKGHMFPPGAAPEEQAEQNVMWNAVIFWTALFWHLPLLASLQGELLDGKNWLPGINIPNQPYRFRFREADNAPAFAALISGLLMPEEGVNWLAENPTSLGNLAGAIWNQYPEMGLIRSLMNQAAEKVESPIVELSGSNQKATPVTEPKYLAPLTQNDQTMQLQPSAEIELVSAAQESPELQELQVNYSPETSVQAGINNSDNEDQDGQHTNVEINDAEEADTELLLSLFTPPAGSEIEAVAQGNEELSTNSSTESGPDELALSVPTLSIKNSKNIQTVAEDSFQGSDAEDNIPLHSVKLEESRANKIKAGSDFLQWLSEGLKSKQIEINQPESRAHAVAGFIFLRVPDIFYLYLRESQTDLSRDSLQLEFEKLHVHRVRRGERFIKAKLYSSSSKEGSFKPVSGYLVKTTHLFRGASSPEDSRLLSFL